MKWTYNNTGKKPYDIQDVYCNESDVAEIIYWDIHKTNKGELRFRFKQLPEHIDKYPKRVHIV